MAEREGKNAVVYRSVSFKKLGSGGASRSEGQQNKSEDLEAVGVALPPELSRAERSWRTRNVSVSRKVSKISATAAGLPTADTKRSSSAFPSSSISPSIRELTEKFSSSGSARTHRASPADGAAVTRGSSTLPRARGSSRGRSPSRKSFHEDSGGSFQDSDTAATDTFPDAKVLKFHSGTDSVSGSDSERKREKRFFTCLPTDGGDNSGKKDGCQINARPADYRKSLTTDEEEDVNSKELSPPYKSHRSYAHCDYIPTHSDRWPSVTKIRQLFDERGNKLLQQHKTDTCESLKAAVRGHLQSHEASGLSLSDICTVGAQSRESCTAKETFCYGVDFNSKVDHRHYSGDEEADVEAPKASGRRTFPSGSSRSDCHRINSSSFRSRSPSAEAEAAHKTSRTTGLTSDPNPNLQPRATSSLSVSVSLDTSSCPSSLQQPKQRERRDRQGVGLPRDSLHSSHSSSRAPAPTSSSSASVPDKATTTSSSTVAPSSVLGAPRRECSPLNSHWRLSSGDEEEVHNRRRRGGGWGVSSGPSPCATYRALGRGATERGSTYLSRSKYGWWGAKAIGRSSGSEEDSSPSVGPHCREAVRRRSLRKKKKISGAVPATGRDDYDNHDGESDDSDSDVALMMDKLERQQQQNPGGEFGGTIQRSHSAREPSRPSNRARVQHWERIISPVMSPTLPGVSRVSKVHILPFASGPGDSHCSSRYSSTETLKEEDKDDSAARPANMFNSGAAEGSASRSASSSMLSKTYHGNFTMYRSPSFGHGDNFSRAPVRVRPKVMPTVAPLPSVPAGEGGGSSGGRGVETALFRKAAAGRVNDKEKKQISMSNPDITSETMTLLNFLKSDLSELKVRRAGGGERSGVGEGLLASRKGSGPHGGTLLPSGRRPSLKDLTATLRRTKSFTYSDKPTTGVRCYLTGGATKRSSSEQQLALDGEKGGGRVLLSDREVESDGGDFRVGRGHRISGYGFDDDDDEVMPTPLQERCEQETRQVIQDICQMCTREDDDDDVGVKRSDADLVDACLQVKKTSAEKKGAESIKEERGTAQEAEFENTKDIDKHEERESRERSGQSMQLQKLNSRSTECWEKSKTQSREPERALLKGDSEESVLYDRSVDELSGHESSLTDEGIVTEPETGPSDLSERSFLGSAGLNLGSRIARDVLGQPVTAWKQSALHEVEGIKQEEEKLTENSLSCANRLNEVSVPPSLSLPVCVAENDNLIMELSASACISNVNSASEGIHTNSAVSQGSAATGGGGFEAPATPSAPRRRRKFSPSGNNNTGSDSITGCHAESTMAAVGNGESTVYRSLSDPMPQRRCSAAEEGNNNFSSVDSNLLGSLSVKGGGGSEASADATMTEYKGSVASDLSVCSDGGLRDDGVRDYSGVIRNIVAEPGAMDKLMSDDHGNGKGPKKKSFSDPSRRSDAPLLSQNDPQFKGQTGSTQPIGELDQSGQIPPSSSEPILSEQREELWDAEAAQLHQVKIVRSQSECTPHPDHHDEDDDAIDGGGEEVLPKFNPKLAEVLSPRMSRRPTRKRPNRLAFFHHQSPFEPLEMGSRGQEGLTSPASLTSFLAASPVKSKPKTAPKHVRHASEPATFVPISPPPQLQPLKETDRVTVRSSADPPVLSKTPGDEVPSLEDVTRKYILELSTSEKDAEGPVPLPGVTDGSQGSVPASEGTGETSNSGLAEAEPQKKSTEDAASSSVPQRTKPTVVSSLFIYLGMYFSVVKVFPAAVVESVFES